MGERHSFHRTVEKLICLNMDLYLCFCGGMACGNIGYMVYLRFIIVVLVNSVED